MLLNRDSIDLFAALNAARTRFLIVGGYALAFHGHPRFTKDLDVWVEPTAANGARVFAALAAFGAPLDKVQPSDFTAPGVVFQIGLPPNRIDVLTGIEGVEFAEAWASRLETTYGAERVSVLSKALLRRNKLAVGRPQDLIDAKVLADD